MYSLFRITKTTHPILSMILYISSNLSSTDIMHIYTLIVVLELILAVERDLSPRKSKYTTSPTLFETISELFYILSLFPPTMSSSPLPRHENESTF